MKKTKLIIMLLVLFLLTGCCDVNYNLSIDNKVMKEEIDISSTTTKETAKAFAKLYSVKQSAYYDMDSNNTLYYDKEQKIIDGSNHIIYTYEYENANLQKSKAINTCYNRAQIIKNDDYIIIKTNTNNACMYKDGEKKINNLTINIKTDLNVKENNADIKKGNTYIWKLDKNNYNKKYIYIKISRKTKTNYSFLKSNLLLIILVIILIAFIIIKKRYEEVNDE